MPMGNGHLFLPVKADIRKKINKQSGDTVKLKLYLYKPPLEISQELMSCFDNEHPDAYKNFQNLSVEKQRSFIDAIYGSKTDEEKIDKIIKMMDHLLHG